MKGQEFERNLCKQFSLWWTEGNRKDIFWRTSGSGARARTRTDKGDNVHKGYGDMMAEDSIGQPLLDKCTFEFKHGYNDFSFLDCIASNQNCPRLVSFLHEVEKDAKDANNYPILVVRKNHRNIVIGIPYPLFCDMVFTFGIPNFPYAKFSKLSTQYNFIFICLENFFDWCHPEFFISFKVNKNEIK